MKKADRIAAVYAAYGIEYQANSGNGLINVPVFGFMPIPVVDGNGKIGAGCWHFSTLPTNQLFDVVINGQSFTVKGTCCCHCEGCYATKGNYNYSNTKANLAWRTILARDHVEFLQRAIIATIKAFEIKLFRWHASGDIVSAEYAAMMKAVVLACPECIFWTYTKATEYETLFDDCPNANIVKSVIPGKGFNFGHCDYILACYEFLKEAGKTVYICRCGIDKNQHCVNCKGCSRNDYVLFIEHSTSYQAEKDPLFPILKALIESQPKQ